MRRTLAEIAEYVGGKIIGDSRIEISRVTPIEEAGTGEITFLANTRYLRHLATCKASVVIVGPGIVSALTLIPGRSFLEVSNPYIAFAKILQLFSPPTEYSRQVSSLAHIGPNVTLEEGVTVFPHAFVGTAATIGRKTVLYPGVFVGEGAQVGAECVLYPNVVVREGCRLGNRVILHPGVVIGSDGFGYAGQGDGRVKIPQIGIVEVQDDVEIGSNSTVDRATLGRTVIGCGTKIDNLVQIAHNVIIGNNSLIAAQAGIAGSSRIGNGVTLAGQVGVINHVEIGDGATIGPQSGIARSVPPGALLSGGVAAAPHHEWLRVMTLLPQLPKLWNQVRRLEKKVAHLVAGDESER